MENHGEWRDEPMVQQEEKKKSKWKMDFQIPYVDQVREDQVSLNENFYKSSLVALFFGSMVSLGASLLMFPPFDLALSPLWMWLRVAGFVVGIIGTRILMNRGDNWGGLVFFYLRKFTGTQLFTAGMIYIFYDMVGLQPIYEFMNLLFYTNASLYAAFLAFNYFKSQGSLGLGIIAGLGIIGGCMAFLLVWFGMDPIIFAVSGGYLLFLGFTDYFAMKESAEYNHHEAWLAGVMGVVWWNGFLVLRCARIIPYLIYFVLRILAK